jgi:hypothetical protein
MSSSISTPRCDLKSNARFISDDINTDCGSFLHYTIDSNGAVDSVASKHSPGYASWLETLPSSAAKYNASQKPSTWTIVGLASSGALDLIMVLLIAH